MRTNANLPTLLLTYEQVGFLLPVLGHRSAPELDQNLTHLVSVGWRKVHSAGCAQRQAAGHGAIRDAGNPRRASSSVYAQPHAGSPSSRR